MYRLDFSSDGETSFGVLDKEVAQRILNKLKWFLQNIESIPPLPLHGKYSGLFKLKAGDWRVIYEVSHDEKVVTVHKVGHRREIYK
mgnify:CR=1 FL=1